MSANFFESTSTDEGLIGQLISEEKKTRESAWSFLYTFHYPSIRDFILRNNGTQHDALDIFQDTLLILRQNIKQNKYREESTLKTYIFGISRNLWIKELERNKKKSVLTADALQAVTQSDYDYLMSIEVIGILMKDLQEDCQRVLHEFYYNHKSMEQLKNMFGVNSIQAMKNKKYRCLGYLTKLVRERTQLTWAHK
ncbi:MAG: sigma-70 family RNA polymerase sigma factor [Chryseolinea sp.]